MTDAAASCLFCRIVSREIPAKTVFEDEEFVAFEDIHPQAPTHILVIPRKHIPSLDELEPGDAVEVGRLLLRIAEVARARSLQDPGYRVVINCGEGAGQSVFHIHAHLLGGRRMGWPPG